MYRHGHTVGGKVSKLYKVWSAMRDRCRNPKNKSFRWYGAKGITVCKEWDNYDVFFNWANKNGYERGMTLDRIDGDKPYCSANCRFVTIQQQQKNKVNNIKYKGETAGDASRRLGGGARLVDKRITTFGWSLKKAFTTPPMRHRYDTAPIR